MMILEKPNSPSSSSADPEESPPPYGSRFHSAGASGSVNSSIRDLPLPPLPLPDASKIHHVKELSLSTVYKNITGTFIIDPDLQGSAVEIRPCKNSKRPHPNVSVSSRHGTVSLNLASSGDNGELASRTHIRVSTRTGDVNLLMFHAPSLRHVNLEAHSQQGNVALLVPKTFCGVIQLRTRRGSLKFLPSFAKSMRILKSNDHEALVLIGETNFSSLNDHSNTADYCQLTTRSSKVTVGLAEEDTYESGPGFWKRMGEKLRGR